MMLKKLRQQAGVGGVVLAAGGNEGFAIARELFRVDGIELDVFVLEERVDEGPFALLEGDGNDLPRKTSGELAGPFVNAFRGLWQGTDGVSALGIDEAHGVLAIRPVDSDDDGARLKETSLG